MHPNTGLVEAIILEVKDRERIGGSFLKSNAICCNPSLADSGSCKLGEVIIQNNVDNPNWPRRIQTSFEGNKEEVTMKNIEVEISSTGMYYLYFMSCDPLLKGTRIKGRTVWRNPDGYLPGKMAPLMTFYGFMSLAYLALGLIWFLRFVQLWKDITQLHYHITAVIALGMCEMAVWYFEYANFNSTGSRPMAITLWAVTFSSVKKTVSRLLLLVVSMGYSVVKPTLGGITSKALILGIIYFIATEALELVEHLGNINDFSGNTKLFLVLPVAFLDSCFILWIFSSLARTLEKLQVIFLFSLFLFPPYHCFSMNAGICLQSIICTYDGNRLSNSVTCYNVKFVGAMMFIHLDVWIYLWFYGCGFSLIKYAGFNNEIEECASTMISNVTIFALLAIG
ncbi:hypothetical protein I3843_09G217900 [Carya illinoinensis]|uniref:GOST seven transmembrane domain-containing protein n=1 Tax=Carya illinoinensis TaxID=32201 RepID=A0A922E985_CARIL|nr:hypothetical protein I3760_09G222800 [Carya illinoinensis]KAG6697920.1 hypothetical protein I3842_09G225600 [Carya illinoinensis]KAG7965328.1 hypothetical protein I3843_09G217900 [Carya illinoinensis]